MPTIIFGILLLLLLLGLLNLYSKADPKVLARTMRISGGILALAASAVLFARAHFEAAIPLALFGLGLLGWGPFASSGMFQRTRRTPGQVSRVRAPFIEMELDHDSGAMRGRILAGRHEGASLDDLELATLLGLLGEFDADSQALLEAYLDRRAPDWRGQTQRQAGVASSGRGPMTEEVARQILGVSADASEEEIGRAHRLLMKKLHPDQGGSNYLAAQINEAKEVLLRGRR